MYSRSIYLRIIKFFGSRPGQDENPLYVHDAESGIISKIVSICGRDATVFGYRDDRYFIDLQAHVTNNPILDRTLTQMPPHAVMIDGGANLGVTAIAMCRFAPHVARVIAVEPSIRARACLDQTIVGNVLTERVTVVPMALSDRAATLPFAEDEYLAGSHIIDSEDQSAPTMQVNTVTLDVLVEQLKLDRVDLVELDIEGYEMEAVKGASATIGRFAPVFVIEFNSFAICAYRRTSPILLLEFILQQFESFTYLHDGVPRAVSTQKEAIDFMYRNMTFSIVDDIRFGDVVPDSPRTS